MGLADITILVTSFMRFGYVQDCLEGIATNLPECSVITVDDSGPDYFALVDAPARRFIQLPFDSGLSAKRNAGVKACQTPFLLLTHDDNDFTSPATRTGIERLLSVLESHPEIDVAAGRHDGRPYEGFLSYFPDFGVIKESKFYFTGGSVTSKPFHKVDLTGNYFLGRIDRLLPWDDQLKLHEHGDWFLQMKHAGRVVVWVPGVIGPCQPRDRKKEHPDYDKYRGRREFHELFLKKWGVKKYYAFDEPVK